MLILKRCNFIIKYFQKSRNGIFYILQSAKQMKKIIKTKKKSLESSYWVHLNCVVCRCTHYTLGRYLKLKKNLSDPKLKKEWTVLYTYQILVLRFYVTGRRRSTYFPFFQRKRKQILPGRYLTTTTYSHPLR